MISKVYGKYVVSCDGCEETTLETDTHDWDEMRQAMWRAGWISKKVRDKWEHRCPECQK